MNNADAAGDKGRRITRAENMKNKQVRVWLDDIPAFRIPVSVWERLQLSEGDCMTLTLQEELERSVLIPAAQKRCLDILLRGDKPKEVVREKLLQEEFPPCAVDAAIEYAVSFHYIDDLRMAKNYIECRRETKSRRELWYRLKEKGISETVIEQAFEQLDPVDPVAQIQALAQKKHFSAAEAQEKEKNRFYQSLIRKGFSYYDIKKAFEDLE